MLRHLARLHAHPLDLDLLVDRLGLARVRSHPLPTPLRWPAAAARSRHGLIGRPELVFVDEPTAGMDPHARRATWELLDELRSDGVTVVLTTHHMDEAERLADLVHIVDRGRLVALGHPRELTDDGRPTLEDVFVELTDPSRPSSVA